MTRRGVVAALSMLTSAWALAAACATAEDPSDAPPVYPDASKIVAPTVDGSMSSSSDSSSLNFDTGLVPLDEASTSDSSTEAGACPAPLGQPCDTEAPLACGFFWSCESWTTPYPWWDAGVKDAAKDALSDADADAGKDAALDAGADAAADVDAGPPTDGVCLPVVFGGGPGDCNDGLNHCEAGTSCLLAARRCLSPQEAECVCNDPRYPGACVTE